MITHLGKLYDISFSSGAQKGCRDPGLKSGIKVTSSISPSFEYSVSSHVSINPSDLGAVIRRHRPRPFMVRCCGLRCLTFRYLSHRLPQSLLWLHLPSHSKPSRPSARICLLIRPRSHASSPTSLRIGTRNLVRFLLPRSCALLPSVTLMIETVLHTVITYSQNPPGNHYSPAETNGLFRDTTHRILTTEKDHSLSDTNRLPTATPAISTSLWTPISC
jgi:hypothetical protein